MRYVHTTVAKLRPNGGANFRLPDRGSAFLFSCPFLFVCMCSTNGARYAAGYYSYVDHPVGKSSNIFRVGIFLDFAWLTTRTPHGAYVRSRTKSN